MGTTIVCCNERNSYKHDNSHIYQINRYVKCTKKDPQLLPESQRDTVSSSISTNSNINNNSNPVNNKKQYLKNKTGEFQILNYDIDEEYFIELRVVFPIIRTIEGMSELNMDKKLFLCGISPKQKNEGSFLLQINLDLKGLNSDEQIKPEILINSHYPHIYPSLIHDKNEKILCIGGKGQTLCELYNLSMNKWIALPELPEERYKCTLCLDNKGDYVYLFGGINSELHVTYDGAAGGLVGVSNTTSFIDAINEGNILADSEEKTYSYAGGLIGKNKGKPEHEDYIDLQPILENLYMEPSDFLNPIKGVEISYE